MKLADSLRLILKLEHCSSSDEVGAAFAETVAPYGFNMVSCGGSRETPSGRVWDFFFNTWPSEWLLEYQRNDYVRVDMLPAIARLSAVPFTWGELLRYRAQTPKQIEFHKRVRELGVIDGFAVPIHQPGGDLGLCVSVSTHIINDPEEKLALHAASLYVYHRCRAIGDLFDASLVKSPLSPRELECLKLVLDGKSDTDIGKIIGISHTTVHYHVERG